MANYSFSFDNVNEALPVLMGAVLEGEEVGSRAGKTRELTHVSIALRKPWQREIWLPERKASLVAQIAETMWVLSGRNDIAWLGHYLPRAKDFSDDGRVWRAGYGPRLRDFHGVDQLAYVVDTLQASPASRQAVISLWDPTVDTTPGKDIACNNWLNFSSRNGELDLHVAIRSNDLMWGWSGINAFEWSALQEIVASILELRIGGLHFSVTSFHLYEQHWAKAEALAQQQQQYVDFEAPQFTGVGDLKTFDYRVAQWFVLEEHIRLGRDVGSNVDNFPEPMLRSWLQVLQWWWTRDADRLPKLRNLRAAALAGVQPNPPPTFPAYVNQLHKDKHAAYGNSWKKRGEMLGIMANIARKIDRLGTNSSDETSADTATDLAVYMAKYRWWLVDQEQADAPCAVTTGYQPYSDYTEPVEALFIQLELEPVNTTATEDLEKELSAQFEDLEEAVAAKDFDHKVFLVDSMLSGAYQLAHRLHK